ncbi:helix-turn-helix transcriptional regulator [Hafnia alvei]|uniref:helix-turn-helix transcriptional regulator n=1 Tax=Hafnia alvei TaxID=569 RepID=UPI00345CC152
MNIISYTDDFYLNSAVRYLFSTEKELQGEAGISAGLAGTMLDYIILFNDKSPSESLMKLSTYNGFKPDDIILVISDVVPIEVITRFIRERCRLFVQSSKTKLNEWLVFLNTSSETRKGVISFENKHKPLLTYTEKSFLNALRMAQTQNEFAKTAEIHRKTASTYKRSVMRKLGAHHTPQLLDYVNAKCFQQILSYL